MKTRIVIITVALFSLFVISSSVFAWTGDTWGPISREYILRNASEMAVFSWTPRVQITNHTSNDYPWLTYSPGSQYNGEAYCLFNDPAQSWSDFYGAVNNTKLSLSFVEVGRPRPALS